MNLAIVHSRARIGVDAPAVRVEVHLGGGLPAMSIVGLPEAAVREAKDRVRAAIQCAQFEFPARRITVNLAPADLPKDGARFDLAIALGILAASGQISADALEGWEFLGELALTGALRGCDGTLAAALAVGASNHRLIVAPDNGSEAALASGVEVRTDAPPGESSADVRSRVEAARRRQLARGPLPNARLGQGQTNAFCRLAQRDGALLERAVESLQLSARSLHRILRVARTIADLDGSDAIATPHLTEAIGYRTLERQGERAAA